MITSQLVSQIQHLPAIIQFQILDYVDFLLAKHGYKTNVKKQKFRSDSEGELPDSNANQSLTDLLLSGPIMTAQGYKNYRDFRKDIKKWTKNLSV